MLGDPRQEAGVDAAFLYIARELGALRLQDDVVLRRKVAEGDALAPGERMGFWHGHHDLFRPCEFAAQGVLGGNASIQADVCRAIEEGCDLQGRCLFMHGHLHRRRNLPVRGQQIGQAPAQDGACRSDIERADQAGANRADLVFRQFDLLLNGAGAREKRFSGLRQLDPSTGSIEKLRPQRSFERLDLLAQRGLGKIQPPRCDGEAALLGHGDEISDLTEIHSEILLIVSFYILDT